MSKAGSLLRLLPLVAVTIASACGPMESRDADVDGWARDLRLLRDSIAALLPDLEPHERALSVHRVSALAADGHTEPARFASHPSLRGEWLPLVLRRFSDGWFVRTGHRRYDAVFGRRIVRIGDLPIETVADRVGAYVSSDNRIGAFDDIGNAMRLSAVLAAVGAVDSVGADVPVTVEDTAEGEQTVFVRPGEQSWVTEEWMDADELTTDAPDPLYRSIESNYGYRYVRRDSMGYVWFGEIRDEGGDSIEEFFGRVFRDLEARSARRLVLDMRENAGGNLDLNGPVLRGVIQSGTIDRPGRFFVVIGRDTYSAAMNLAVLLERYTHALFVGEPTGATPNHFGDTRTITLPSSGIDVEISELYWQNSDPRDDRPWITPDLPAPLSSGHFFAHRDPVVERIRSFVATDSLVDAFGDPMQRWRRENQTGSWPPLGLQWGERSER